MSEPLIGQCIKCGGNLTAGHECLLAPLSSKQCAAYGCQNKHGEGVFIGDYCGPCDAALRYGTATFGTSFIFQQQREIERLREMYEKQFGTGETSESIRECALRDLSYRDGAKQALAIAHQSLEVADVWFRDLWERTKEARATLKTAGLFQAPIAKLTVHEDDSLTASLYAPGLPPGEFDLYCEPPSLGGQKVPFFQPPAIEMLRGWLDEADDGSQAEGLALLKAAHPEWFEPRWDRAQLAQVAQDAEMIKSKMRPLPSADPAFHHDLCDAEDIEDCHGYEWVAGGKRGKCPCDCHAKPPEPIRQMIEANLRNGPAMQDPVLAKAIAETPFIDGSSGKTDGLHQGDVDATKRDYPARRAERQQLCEDCPPIGYVTDKTRCAPCPRRASTALNGEG